MKASNVSSLLEQYGMGIEEFPINAQKSDFMSYLK